jgi:hypothetical protein
MDALLGTGGGIAVIIGLVQLAKQVGLPVKYAAPLSLVLGVAGSFLFPAVTVGATILAGVVLGLAASGLYSGGSNAIANFATK